MGNAASSSSLGIQLDQPAIYAGGTVSGKVFLQVRKDTEADTLQLMLVGQEHAHVHWTTQETTGSGDNKRTVTKHHHAYANRILVQIDVPLAQFPTGRVAPGNYEFPFSATLPPGLPTSMFARGGGGDCSISYALKARLHRPSWFKWDTTSTRSIMVQSTPLPPSPVPFFATPQTVPVTLCCCFSRGKIHIGAGVDDTLLGRGQRVGVGIAVQNESSKKLECVTATIQEHVVWRAAGHSNTSLRTIAETAWDMDAMVGLTELSKEDLKAAREAAKASPGEAHTKTLETLAASLLSGRQRETLTVAPDARDSYRGSCLSTTHRCYVTSKTPCCVTDPQLEVPVRIGTLPLPLPPQPNLQPMPVAVGAVVMPTAAAYPVPPPMVLAEAIPLDNDEQQAISAVPADWSGVVVAEAVVLPMGQAVVGGATQQSGGEDAEEQAHDGAPMAVEPAAVLLHQPGTMAALKEIMDRAFDDLTVLADLLGRPESAEAWRPLLENLSPADFGTIVGEVNLEFDQPKVAELLGRQLRGGVTAAHIIEANRKAAENQPPTIVTKLAPLCVDLHDNLDAIETGLSEWDKILSKRALRPEA